MATSLPPPPPPPPPPPAIEDEPPSQPTFMEQWLETEKSKSLPSRKSKQEFFEKQYLFPRYIPQAAMCNVDPMLSLISNHNLEEPDGGIDDQTTPPTQHRTALDDVRKIASLCATYKSTAILNHKEFQYKRAVQLKEALDQSTIDTFNKSESDPLPPQPPYHPEYTPLSQTGNFVLAKAHNANYNLCLANAVCPDRTQGLLKCWKSVDPRWVQMMEKEGMGGYICLEERDAVERCVGLGVQTVMKDILG